MMRYKVIYHDHRGSFKSKRVKQRNWFHFCVGLTKVRECLAEVDKASPMIPADNTLVKTDRLAINTPSLFVISDTKILFDQP